MKNIRLLLVAILTLAAACCAQAQGPSMPVNYRKDKPVQLTAYEDVYDAKYASWWQKKLENKAGFTDAEVGVIMTRLNAGGNKPGGMNESRRNARVLAHYKAYEQYRYTRMGYQYALVWLPYGENQHMPENLRPTNKEGGLFLLNGRDVTAEGKDFNGAALPLAGTPVSDDRIPSGTATSGTTAGGIQYTSNVDMSAFGPGLLGCMAIYPSNGSAFMYVVSVYGASLGDKAKVAEEAYRITGLADRNFRYEWFAGTNASTLQQRYGKTMSVKVLGKYTIQ